MDSTETTSTWTGVLSPASRSSNRRLGARPEHVVRWLLPGAAFLFGVAVAAVVFVSASKQTATRTDRVQAQQAATAHALKSTEQQLAQIGRRLSSAQASLAKAQRHGAALAVSLTAARAAAASQAAKISRLSAPTSALAQHTSALAADLAALEASLAKSGQSVDPAYLGTQIAYLTKASRTAQQDAASLQTQVAHAEASTASQRPKRH